MPLRLLSAPLVAKAMAGRWKEGSRAFWGPESHKFWGCVGFGGAFSATSMTPTAPCFLTGSSRRQRWISSCCVLPTPVGTRCELGHKPSFPPAFGVLEVMSLLLGWHPPRGKAKPGGKAAPFAPQKWAGKTLKVEEEVMGVLRCN